MRSVLLGLERNAFPHLDNRHTLGLVLCILRAFSFASAFYALAVNALLAWAMYGEKLSRKQWVSIGIVLTGVVALRFV